MGQMAAFEHLQTSYENTAAAAGRSNSARLGLGVALALFSAACATPGLSDDRQPHAERPPILAPGGAPDASYDWHGLVLVRFGTLLKESPIPLHEVLLFHEAAASASDIETKDCYAMDGTPPRFVGRRPDQYLLCFDRDRLSRVEVSVRLTAEEAPQVFTQACSLWLQSTAPLMGSGRTCDGQDGGIAFAARLGLGLAPGEAAAALSMTLSSAADAPPAP